MAQLVVRNLDDRVKARLRKRAERNGRSMEEEVRVILRDALREKKPSAKGLGTRLAECFAGIGLRPGETLEPLPRQAPRAARFDE